MYRPSQTKPDMNIYTPLCGNLLHKYFGFNGVLKAKNNFSIILGMLTLIILFKTSSKMQHFSLWLSQ